MTMRRVDLQPTEPFTADFIDRAGAFNPGALEAATAIIEEVRAKGDAALRAYTEKFDGVAIDDFRVLESAIEEALAAVDPDTIDALNQAAAQIRDFHERQRQQSWFFARQDGAIVGSKVTPLDSVGIYVPGGRALYPSTVLMNALPAQVAGVERIVCVTPPTKDGTLDSTVLAACKIAGVTEIYTVGGAQAVAALAYGTETIRPVAKVTGPGNAFVAAAKKLVSGDVGIDMIAGPSEVCVVADETADPSMVAIDLMAQAEHDPLAACYLVTFSDAYADAVEAAIADHMERSTRADITRASLDDHGLIVVCPTMEQALEAVNVIAPEHLEMHVANAMEHLGAIRNAGAIFLGEWTPEAVGDYVAGPNHTLPTGGTARYSSPLSVDDFVKKSSVIQYTAAALRNDARSVVQIATHEGLWAHAQSVALRLQSLLAAEQASVAGGSAAAGVDAGAGATAAGSADE
ncbi:histidinol dehydrogenase [Adlercreutzia muris]|uniref:histidinol dehydrogenase n=1 Tax=Adlercreutzia muris TaxID=1796610 RepID=UPI0021D612D1|nr:histidinol dehydrogenase [Adlercreutzia muris]MCU7585219.1 histidinol dehydrogenase [Adlercreutzia muris]